MTAIPGAPAHSVVEFRPRRSRYCLAVFVLNEGERIRRQLRRMQGIDIDVVIVDGGSTDGALDPEWLADAGVRALLVKRAAGRLGTQIRIAIAWAMQEGYAGLVTMDGNDKDDPAGVTHLTAALTAGVDHVQGSRFVRGGAAINTPPARWLGIRLVHAPLISLAAGFRYTDTTNGFRAYSRRLLLDPRVAPLRDIFAGYELHYYLAIRAARLGFSVAEVPVIRSYPASGATPTKIHGLRGNLAVIRALLRACLGRYNPPLQLSHEEP